MLKRDHKRIEEMSTLISDKKSEIKLYQTSRIDDFSEDFKDLKAIDGLFTDFFYSDEYYTQERYVRYKLYLYLIENGFCQDRITIIINHLKEFEYSSENINVGIRELVRYYYTTSQKGNNIILAIYGTGGVNVDILEWSEYLKYANQYVSSIAVTTIHLNKVWGNKKIDNLELNHVLRNHSHFTGALGRIFDKLKNVLRKDEFIKFEVVPYKKESFMVYSTLNLKQEEIDKPNEIHFKNGSYEIKVDKYYRGSGTKTIKEIVNKYESEDMEK